MEWIPVYFAFTQKVFFYLSAYKAYVDAHFLTACLISLASSIPIFLLIIAPYFVIYLIRQKIEEYQHQKHLSRKGKWPK